MRLLLIRHGQTPSNVLGLLDTAVPGPGLTDLGDRAGRRAAGHPRRTSGSTLIYASTQPRAQLTAAPLAAARDLQMLVRDGLREVGAGDLEMRGDEDADPDLPDDRPAVDGRRSRAENAGRAERDARC